MKILIVNTSDIQGGAAKAAYRLHKSLLSQNIDSQMLVQGKSGDDYTVIGPETKIQRAISMLRPFLDLLPTKLYKNKSKILFSVSSLPFGGIVNKINNLNPDIVHLHWICGGMIKIEEIAGIKSPIVWSLHDNWAFTGGCHVMWECDKYKRTCGSCPRLGSGKENDLSRKIWNRKKKVFDKTDITIIGLSRWLNDCSKNSALLKNKKHVNLPNPIDTSVFKPFDKKQARELWNLPRNKKIVLFGANSATSDVNKGFKELYEALYVFKSTNVELVVFGSSEPKDPPNFGFKTHYLGHLHDDVGLVTLYSAADVMIVPSLQENLSNAIMESLACGTPVVGFSIGGNSDLIEHQITGYLAKPYNATDLAQGIEWVMNASNYQEISQNSREKVLREFDSQVVAKKYIDLYNQIIKGVV
jgi:glycosyltransferase involved in cell wall biosynthesis